MVRGLEVYRILPTSPDPGGLHSEALGSIYVGYRHARRLVFQLAEVAVPRGGISTSAGAYRRAPSSIRVASILGIIGGDEDSQGGAVRLDELKHVQTC